MHRTTGSDSTTIGGYTLQHINQSLPGTPGTTLDGEWANAVQEEIISILTEAGLSVETAPATDRSNGFAQMKTAIFDSAAIDTAALSAGAVTDAKVTSVALDKFIYGVMNITEDNYTLILQKDLFSITHVSPSYPVETAVFNYQGIVLANDTAFGEYTKNTILDDSITLADTSDTNYDVWTTELNLNRLQLLKQRDDGSTDVTTTVSTAGGFTHTISGSAETTYSSTFSHDGISFTGSNKTVKHRVVEVPTSNPYLNDVATGLPTTVDVLSISFTAKKSSNGIVYSLPTSDIDVEKLYVYPNSGDYDLRVETGVDVSTGWEDLFAIIWYAD